MSCLDDAGLNLSEDVGRVNPQDSLLRCAVKERGAEAEATSK